MTGRVPPSDLDAEQAVLGCLMVTSQALPDVLDVITSGDFHKLSHQAIFEAIVSLYSRGEAIDIRTVHDTLKTGGEGRYTNELGPMAADPQAVTSNVVRYASIIRRHAMFRNLVSLGREIAELGWAGGPDAEAAIDKAEALVHHMGAERRIGPGSRHLGESLEDWCKQVEERGQHGMAGIPTGFADLDRYLAGMREGQLITVAARPSMGKSTFAGALAVNAAFAGHPVLFVSVEMSMAELQDRLMAQCAKVWLDSIRQGKLTPKDWEAVHKVKPLVTDYPIWIEDDPNATLFTIRSEARRVARQAGPLGLVIVDYLQLLSSVGKQESRQVEVAELSRGLKKLAGELAVPVVALSQLNRNLELREDKWPKLADLRESGAIENDSDVVMFLYRDEVYKPNSQRQGICDVIVAKQRNGPIGSVGLSYDQRTGRFGDLSRREGVA